MKFFPSKRVVQDLGRKFPGLIVLGLLVFVYVSLSRSGPSSSNEPRVGKYWVLYDDSRFEVQTVPWPPRRGNQMLVAKVGPSPLVDGAFNGTVSYRLNAQEQNTAPWLPMKRKGANSEQEVIFEAPVSLPKGTFFIQFKVPVPASGRGPEELTDWFLVIP